MGHGGRCGSLGSVPTIMTEGIGPTVGHTQRRCEQLHKSGQNKGKTCLSCKSVLFYGSFKQVG